MKSFNDKFLFVKDFFVFKSKISKFIPKSSQSRGFTLPELLIVMAVIAGLAALTLTNFPASQKRARDTRRRSDVKQYQTAMEVYYNKNDRYPVMSGNPSTAGNCTTLGLTNCPNDPQAPSQNYGVSSTATNYVFWARLQLPNSTPPTYFITCSNGVVKEFQKSGNPATSDCT